MGIPHSEMQTGRVRKPRLMPRYSFERKSRGKVAGMNKLMVNRFHIVRQSHRVPNGSVEEWSEGSLDACRIWREIVIQKVQEEMVNTARRCLN